MVGVGVGVGWRRGSVYGKVIGSHKEGSCKSGRRAVGGVSCGERAGFAEV